MLDKKHRLPNSISFKDSQIFFSNAFSIKAISSQNEVPRFGIVVGKKIDKRAVGRNKIKRQIRDSIDKLLPKIDSIKDVLIITRAGIRGKNTQEIFILLEESLKKLKLLK